MLRHTITEKDKLKVEIPIIAIMPKPTSYIHCGMNFKKVVENIYISKYKGSITAIFDDMFFIA